MPNPRNQALKIKRFLGVKLYERGCSPLMGGMFGKVEIPAEAFTVMLKRD